MQTHPITREGEVILVKCDYDPSYAFRAKGLLGRENIGEGVGIFLSPCSSIHMFGMKFAIDVVFVNRRGKILRIYHSIKPWRLSWIHLTALGAIEARAGWAESCSLSTGQKLCFGEIF